MGTSPLVCYECSLLTFPSMDFTKCDTTESIERSFQASPNQVAKRHQNHCYAEVENFNKAKNVITGLQCFFLLWLSLDNNRYVPQRSTYNQLHHKQNGSVHNNTWGICNFWPLAINTRPNCETLILSNSGPRLQYKIAFEQKCETREGLQYTTLSSGHQIIVQAPVDNFHTPDSVKNLNICGSADCMSVHAFALWEQPPSGFITQNASSGTEHDRLGSTYWICRKWSLFTAIYKASTKEI